MTAGELFGRAVALDVGTAGGAGVRHAGLRVAFDVTQSRTSTPNEGRVSVYNLAPDTLNRLSARGAVLRLSAGYGDALGLVLSGDVPRGGVTVERVGADTVTRIELLDGGDRYRGGRVDLSWSGAVGGREVLRAVVDAAGYALTGGVPVEISALTWPAGLSLHGSTRAALDRVTTAAGLRWFVRDGALYLLAEGAATGEPAVRLSPGTGLIGSPAPVSGAGGAEGPPAGSLAVRVLLTPAIRPGRRVVVEAEGYRGTLAVWSVRHNGDTHARAWYSDVVGVPVVG